MKLKSQIPMWTEVREDRIFLLTESQVKSVESCILHTEPNTVEGMAAMWNFIVENFASTQIED